MVSGKDEISVGVLIFSCQLISSICCLINNFYKIMALYLCHLIFFFISDYIKPLCMVVIA